MSDTGLTAEQFIRLVVNLFRDSPDDHVVSLGDWSEPVAEGRRPVFCPIVRVTVGDFRRWDRDARGRRQVGEGGVMEGAMDQTETARAEARRAAFDEAARLHDAEAEDLSRRRDVGMANHHRAWAKKIRDAGGVEPPAPATDRSAIPFNAKRLGRRT